MIKNVNLENFDIKTKFSVPEQRENLTSGESISKSCFVIYIISSVKVCSNYIYVLCLNN